MYEPGISKGIQGEPQRKVKTDLYEHHDYYMVDELLSDEHKMARSAVRDWVKQEVSPIIEDYSHRSQCPTHLFKGLAEIGAFGPSIPTKYGGGGMTPSGLAAALRN